MTLLTLIFFSSFFSWWWGEEIFKNIISNLQKSYKNSKMNFWFQLSRFINCPICFFILSIYIVYVNAIYLLYLSIMWRYYNPCSKDSCVYFPRMRTFSFRTRMQFSKSRKCNISITGLINPFSIFKFHQLSQWQPLEQYVFKSIISHSASLIGLYAPLYLERFSDFVFFIHTSQIWGISLIAIKYSHEYFWHHVIIDS